MDSTDKHLHDDLLDWAIIGASHMAHGLSDFPSWSEAILAEEDSESIRPFLPVIFENSKKILERTENIFEAAEQRRPKVRTQATQDSTHEMTVPRDPKIRRIESIAALVSIALLVLSANLRDPSLWLVAPAWLVLALIAYLRFDETASDSPYKSAFYLMGIPLLFYAALWRTAFYRFADVLSQPSWRHIYALVSSRSFLVLVILYLGAVSVFYSERLRRRGQSSEIYKRTVGE